MKTTVFSIFFLLVSCGQAKQPSESNLNITNGKQISASEYPGVVAIKGGCLSRGKMNCTGVFITPRILLTANHCVDKPEKWPLDSEGFWKEAPISDEGGVCADKVLTNHSDTRRLRDRRGDLALLVFREDVAPETYPIARRSPEAGDDIVIVGYGRYDAEEKGTHGDKRVGYNVVHKRDDGLIRVLGTAEPSSFDGTDAVSASGDSGGPMFFRGNLVGITSSGIIIRDRKLSKYVDLNGDHAKDFFRKAHRLGIDAPFSR